MKTNTKMLTEDEHSSILESSSPDYLELPVIKIDSKGKIIYANTASFEYLSEWLQTDREYLPEYFLKTNPGILNPDANFSIPLVTGNAEYKLDVIGFRESGYVGLYGFERQD